MTIADTLTKGAVGLVSAALVSFGGLVLSERTEQAVQATQLSNVTATQVEEDKTIRHLDETVQQLDKSVAVLSEKLSHGNR